MTAPNLDNDSDNSGTHRDAAANRANARHEMLSR
jgi:hypothetical protein